MDRSLGPEQSRSKVHLASKRGTICGAGRRWASIVITTVRRMSSRVTCKNCLRLGGRNG